MTSTPTTRTPGILVVEDDETIGRALESALGVAGYSVHRERGGVSALDRIRSVRPDLVLLDLGLPDMDGLTVCRELRMSVPDAVIVLLTARGDQIDIISGLESGADDYLLKPFSMIELLARIRAHLRRAGSESSSDDSPSVLGALTVDVAARRATVDGFELRLPAREFDLLVRLAREPGVAVSREQLMADVWDSNWFGSTKTLDVHISSLRRHLRNQRHGVRMPAIVTLRGHGYRLDLDGN